MASGLEELGIVDDDTGAAPTETSAPVAADQSDAEPEPAADLAVLPMEGILEQCSLFTGLLPVHLERMAKLAQVLDLKKNEHVFHHGDDGDGLYIIVEGAIRISRNVSGIGEEALAVLRNGNHFGEMSLIDDDVPRSADAICHESTKLVKLPKHDLRDLMFVDRELAYELLWRFVRTLATRLRDSNDRLMMLSVSSKF